MPSISDELKAKMAEGRRKAKAEREAAKAAAPQAPAPETEDIADMAMTEDEHRPAPEPEVDPLPEPTSPFEIFVAELSEETRAELSYNELREIFDQNEREAKAERKKQLRAAAAAKAKDHARASAGVMTPVEVERKQVAEKNNRMVRATMKMPFLSDTGGTVADGVTIDGVKYLHGHTYTIPMGRALVLRDIIFQNQQAELTFEGKGRLHGLRQQRSEIINEARFG